MLCKAKWETGGGGWGSGRGEGWGMNPAHTGLKSVFGLPTQCFNGYDININRLPSKAGFPDALEQYKILELYSHKVPISWSWVLPREPTLSSQQSPTGSATTSACHLGSIEVLTPNIRHSASCLAQGKLSGPGRPFLPLKESYRIKLQSLTCFLSPGVPCLPIGEMLPSCSPHMLSHFASRFALWTWAQGRWELESSRGRDMPGQKVMMAGREESRQGLSNWNYFHLSLLCVVKSSTSSSSWPSDPMLIRHLSFSLPCE